ncbi:MAG: hypothetical protein AAGA17_01310 [Actinomycetota bacterium]
MSEVSRRVDLALLAPVVAAGALLGHGIGYGIGGAATTTDHAHVALAWPLLSVIAAAGCLALSVRQLRRTGTVVGRRTLVVGHVVAYLLLESIEALATVPLGHLTSLGFVLGLLSQPLVALGVERLLDLGSRLLGAPGGAAVVVPPRTSALVPVTPTLVTGVGAPLGSPRRRGPPLPS